MSRLKQNQITEGLIEAISSIPMNRCSLSSGDVKILEEAIMELKSLKKGGTNEKRLLTAFKVIILLSKSFQ